MQGVELDYQTVCSTAAIGAHEVILKAENKKKLAKQRAELKEKQEKRLVLEAKFQSAAESSKSI